jgi:di/tricarboxylate transporter
MTPEQISAFALLGGAVVLFIWGRVRYDVVALGALLAGVLIGVISYEDAFAGFSSDVVVIIGSALVVSAAVARSGVMESLLRPVLARLTSAPTQVPTMVASVGLLSMITKNVGALAIFMPIAMQLARKTGSSPACLLMPMAFASLMGGLVTLVGTSPNILVSEVRENLTGESFGMFDYAPVGLAICAVGFLFLAFGYRLLPSGRRGAAGMDAALQSSSYVAEVEAPEDWSREGSTLADLNALAEGEVHVVAIVRHGQKTMPLPDTEIRPGDRLLLQGEQQDLDTFLGRAKLKHYRADASVESEEPTDEVRAHEAVVTRDSVLNGRSAAEVELYERYGVNLLAVSREGERVAERMKTLKLRIGDVVVLQGPGGQMPDIMGDLGVLPLAERDIRLGARRRSVLPLLILLAAMGLVAFEVLPVGIAFFAAAVAMIATSSLPLRDAYDSLDGPVLVLVAALIPVSEAIRTTGGTELIAGALSQVVQGVPPMGALALVMAAGMAVTPFLNNAATVLVLGPIVGLLAQRLGMNPDPFLMAVAVGAACDFLTPIGHQCNTLVMGPGGYKFTDYFRLGAPLSLIVLVVGVPVIAMVWPLG